MRRAAVLLSAIALLASCDSPAEDPTSPDLNVSPQSIVSPQPSALTGQMIPGRVPGCPSPHSQPPFTRGGITWSVFTKEMADHAACIDRARGRSVFHEG